MRQKEIVIEIPDVKQYTVDDYSPKVQKMLCYAKKLGQSAEVIPVVFCF